MKEILCDKKYQIVANGVKQPINRPYSENSKYNKIVNCREIISDYIYYEKEYIDLNGKEYLNTSFNIKFYAK